MNLSTLFDDDERTAADGAYLRLLRTRKWLILASVAILAYRAGNLSLAELNDLTPVFTIDDRVLRAILSAIFLYLLAHAILLSVQVLTSYGAILEVRFRGRHERRLAEVQGDVARARDELRALEGAYPGQRDDPPPRVVAQREIVQSLEAERLSMTYRPEHRATFWAPEMLIDFLRIVPAGYLAYRACDLGFLFTALGSST